MINGYDVMLNVQNMINSENYDVEVESCQIKNLHVKKKK